MGEFYGMWILYQKYCKKVNVLIYFLKITCDTCKNAGGLAVLQTY